MPKERGGDLRRRIKERLEKIGRPTTEKDLLKQLRVKGDARQEAKRTIEAMLEKGELAATRANRIGLPQKMNLLRGRLETKRGGFGFVVPLEPGESDVYVAGPNLGEALHGDVVLVHIDRRGPTGRPEGRIVDVVERRAKQIVGRLAADANGTRVVPFDPRMLYEVFLPAKDLRGATPGDMVVVELTRYPAPFRAPMGRILEVLGRDDEPGVDVQVIIAKHGLPDEFPSDVLAEAEGIPDTVDLRTLGDREDFRARSIVTIDGETARDFDDAVEVEVLDSGNYRLGVHIADVSHYVREGSVLDEEAFERGTSVYFPDRAVPMLPERLSNGICSLNPGVDRLVQSVYVEVTPDGRVVGHRFADGVIRSAARMTYTRVREILVDKNEARRREYASLVPHFERMLELYKVLRARREARGSIDFDRPEAEVVLNDDGRVMEIRVAERNVAHRIIEEFMLLANETVAAALDERDVPSIYRVHEEPDEDRVMSFEDFLVPLGHRLRAAAEKLHPRVFQRLLRRIQGKPEEKLLSYMMLRTMKQAVYSEQNEGHYALAAKNYTHFTSPIRRYPDLIVHRVLREWRKGGAPPAAKSEQRLEHFAAIAQHSSETERRADEAERELVEWKKVRFMSDKVGDVFDGFITGVTSFGLYVELVEYFIEGLVHISTLVDDYYHHNEDTHTLRGESTGRIFRLADPVTVQVVRVDLANRQIELQIEGLEPRLVRVRARVSGKRKPKTRHRKR